MTNTNHGGTPAGTPGEGSDAIEELDALWEKLEEDLTAYLSTMVDPDEGDHLLIELTDPDPEGDAGCPPYAQFAAFGDGRMIRAEVSGNAYLLPQYRLGEEGSDFFALVGWSGNDATEQNWYLERPVTGADEIANHVVWALRHHFGVAHPQLLTYQAWGPAADRAERSRVVRDRRGSDRRADRSRDVVGDPGARIGAEPPGSEAGRPGRPAPHRGELAP